VKRAGHKTTGKKQGSVTYSTGRKDKVSNISLLCVWRIRERFLFTRNGFKFLMHIESKTSQFEIIKSLAHLIYNLTFKKVLNFYLLQNLRALGDKPRNILATKTALNFSGPYSRVGSAKLTSHSARSNWEIYISSPEEALPLVSTKNRDLWEGAIFWACAE